jgi:hypothetical protein
MAGKLGNGGAGRGADDHVEAREISGQGGTRAGELEAVRAGSWARTSEAAASSGQLQRWLRSTPAASPVDSVAAPAAAPVNSGGSGVGGEEGELFFLFKIIFRIF